LENNREAVLTLRSATRGIIDYTEADILNPVWWRRWRLIIRTLIREDNRSILHDKYQFDLALVSHGQLGSDTFKSVQETAREAFEDLKATARPWNGRATAEDRRREEKEIFDDEWEYHFGFRPDDIDALEEWESEVAEITNSTFSELDEKKAKDAAFKEKFQSARDNVLLRRLRQQGRG
jgi:hypothetical protein